MYLFFPFGIFSDDLVCLAKLGTCEPEYQRHFHLYTPGSVASVIKYSLMVLHVSDGKWVHLALVNPKNIVPYYVVWGRNTR